MTDTLENGIKLPAKGSRDWYSDASSNAHLIDQHLGDEDVHLTDDDRTAISSISSKADASDVYTKTQVDTALSSKADATNVYTKNEVDTSLSNKANSSDLTTHTSNTDVHVTTSDKTTWNAKQDALTDTQLSACNSGITSDKVAQYDGYASSKANDSSVVHTSGDETISGNKTFRDVVLGTDNFTIQSGGNWDEGARITLNKKSENESIIFQTFDSNGNTFAYIMNNNALYPYFNNQNNLGASTTKWKDVYATSFFGGANNIDCSVDSMGVDWIRYSNGIQIYWGTRVTETKTVEILFPVPFLNIFYGFNATSSHNTNVYINERETTRCTIETEIPDGNNRRVDFMMIGKWK